MIRNPKTGALEPALNSVDIVREFPEIRKYVDVDFKMVENIDSSNMHPDNWTNLAKAIHKIYDKYDGFVVAHGTDTMAYTASALSFAMQNLSKPIIFTGSLIPLSEIGSDGRNNLIFAFLTAALDIAEVCVTFANKILRGNRAKKFHESFVAVFHSPNYPELGELGRPTQLHDWRKKRRKRILRFEPNFNQNISLLKLFPGFNPEIIDNVLERGAEGVIIEAFGPGNVPFLNNSLIPKLEKARKMDIPVIIKSQMEKGVTNLSTYEVGLKAQKAGAISAHDMTTEATVAKLMWALAQTSGRDEIAKIIETDLAGEIEI